MSENAKLALFSLVLISSVFGVMFGVGTALLYGRCDYTRLIEYHPAHVVACELFRDRRKP